MAPKLPKPTGSSLEYIRNLYDYDDYNYYDTWDDETENVDIKFDEYYDKTPRYKVYPQMLKDEEKRNAVSNA